MLSEEEQEARGGRIKRSSRARDETAFCNVHWEKMGVRWIVNAHVGYRKEDVDISKEKGKVAMLSKHVSVGVVGVWGCWGCRLMWLTPGVMIARQPAWGDRHLHS